MPLLANQIICHPDTAEELSIDAPITPYTYRPGFSWFLLPITLKGKKEWLLLNTEFGYCTIIIVPQLNAEYIADTALTAIEVRMPDDREEDNVSVDLSGEDVAWHTSEKMPEHVAQRYKLIKHDIQDCRDRHDVDELLDEINEKPITLSGRTFAPAEGLEGSLLELADKHHHYIETTPWWKQVWHIVSGKDAPWLEGVE